ncbi:MAG: ribosome silencing factor [Candidatus Omnitrophica bacterium]|nr:ribosome silencing factor [Candidatus Omnitrophota bacterium]
MKIKDKVYLIAQAALDKKAKDIVILDMKRPTQICDFFIIASGSSVRQVKAISDNIEDKTRQEGIRPLHIEGYNEGSWVLLDYHDIVVHVFVDEKRDFYDLERLWADARKAVFNDREIKAASRVS